MDVIYVNTWSRFRECIQAQRSVVPVYWRGQKCASWPLASSFERIILSLAGGKNPGASQLYPYDGRYHRQDQVIWTNTFYQSLRDRYLQAFKASAVGLRETSPAALVDDEWWALGRHYGLITPLLDWSESPYIAAFFALSELYAEMRAEQGLTFGGKQAAVFRLMHNDNLEGDGLRVVRTHIEELTRMHAQLGLFTFLDSEKYFELEGFISDTGRTGLLTKFVLSDQLVLDGLRDLRDFGITYGRLFPDLSGAALSANQRWDIF